jgi:aldose 1-epimerase
LFPHRGTSGSAAAFLGLFLLVACESRSTGTRNVERTPFGQTPDGESVELFVMRNSTGLELRAMTYGATIVSLRTPDRNGHLDDIVLGFDSLPGYLQNPRFFGAIVGRYANRIAKGRFTLDSVTYELATNRAPNHLHGGAKGFDKVVWAGAPFENDSTMGVVFIYDSLDGEEGYPGNLSATVTYTLTHDDRLIVDYHATTDKATPINLSQHSYFNLAGAGKGDILRHELTIVADSFTPVDSTLIPTGKVVAVAGTPFDFRAPTTIGSRIDQDDAQLRYGGGYDHNFVLNRQGEGLQLAARLVDPTTGRFMEVHTTEPGLQLSSANRLDANIIGRNGAVYDRRTGVCLETQHFPDSPNQPSFPSTVLRPGEEYRSRTVFVFGVTK